MFCSPTRGRTGPDGLDPAILVFDLFLPPRQDFRRSSRLFSPFIAQFVNFYFHSLLFILTKKGKIIESNFFQICFFPLPRVADQLSRNRRTELLLMLVVEGPGGGSPAWVQTHITCAAGLAGLAGRRLMADPSSGPGLALMPPLCRQSGGAMRLWIRAFAPWQPWREAGRGGARDCGPR